MKYDELKTMEDAMDLGHICQVMPYIYVYKPDQDNNMAVGITIGAEIKHAAAYRFDAVSLQQLITELEELHSSMVVDEDELKVGDKVILSHDGIIKWCENGVKDEYNPRNTLGTVTGTNISVDLNIGVEWTNGVSNEYLKQHLTKIKV